MSRIYLVQTITPPSGAAPAVMQDRLVNATSQAAALRHVVKDTLAVSLASQAQLVTALTSGIKVESAANGDDAE